MTAGDAVLSMDADHSPALRTLPSILLSHDKFIQSKLLYALLILCHAHAVLRSIAFVHLPEPRAGESGALETEPLLANLTFCLCTMLDPAHDTMLRLINVVAVATQAAVPRSLVANAKPAVHSARRDHRRVEQFRIHRLSSLHGLLYL